MVYRLLQDHGAGLEVAARCGLGQRGHGLFADIVFAVLVHRAAALGAGAQRGRVAKVDDLAAFGVLVVTKVKLELVVLGFFVELDDHFGRERPAGLGSETVQRADLLVAQELFDFGHFKGTAGRRLAKREAATFAGAGSAHAGVAAVVFLDDAAAVGAGRLQRGVVAGNGVLVVALGLVDQALGHAGDLGHEAFAAELALLHLRQLVLPLAGQVGA